MTDIDTLCESTKLRLIACALGLQQCTKTAACIIPLPGTENVIAIGPRDWIAKNVGAATTQASTAQAELLDDLQQTVSDFRKATYEFARGQDPENHASMMAAQRGIFHIARALAATSSTDAQAAAEVRDAWISVDERLPEDEVPVLAYGAKRTEWAVMQRISGDWNIETASDFHSSYAPKFWMPLPAPPKRAGDTGEQADGGAA